MAGTPYNHRRGATPDFWALILGQWINNRISLPIDGKLVIIADYDDAIRDISRSDDSAARAPAAARNLGYSWLLHGRLPPTEGPIRSLPKIEEHRLRGFDIGR